MCSECERSDVIRSQNKFEVHIDVIRNRNVFRVSSGVIRNGILFYAALNPLSRSSFLVIAVERRV